VRQHRAQRRGSSGSSQVASGYRLLQAEELLREAGYFQHTDYLSTTEALVSARALVCEPKDGSHSVETRHASSHG
jgi:hypothetical protein